MLFTRHEPQQPTPTVTHRQTRHKMGTVTPAQQPKGNPNSHHTYRKPHPQPQTALNPPQAPHRNPRTATTTPPLLVPNSRNQQKETLIAKTNSNPHKTPTPHNNPQAIMNNPNNPHSMRPHPQTIPINISHGPPSPQAPSISPHPHTTPIAPQAKARRDNTSNTTHRNNPC